MNHVYSGSPKNVGRFGLLQQGDVIDMTPEEMKTVEGDSNFVHVPQETALRRKMVRASYDAKDYDRIVECNHVAPMTVKLPPTPEVGTLIEVFDVSDDGAAANPITIDSGPELIRGSANWIAGVRVDAPGSRFVTTPAVAFSGDGAGAAGTAVMQVLAFIKVAGGTGYSVGDALTVQGGTSSIAAVLTVDTVDANGSILTAHVSTAGSYSELPAGPVTVTGSSGFGAVFALSCGLLDVVMTERGEDYTFATCVISGGGGSGAALTPLLESADVTIAQDGGRLGFCFDGVAWRYFPWW